MNFRSESYVISGMEVQQEEVEAAALSPEELSCPSDNVISTRYRCKVSRKMNPRNLLSVDLRGHVTSTIRRCLESGRTAAGSLAARATH